MSDDSIQEKAETDPLHTKVDPYQDLTYNAPPQSPAVTEEKPKPVGKND